MKALLVLLAPLARAGGSTVGDPIPPDGTKLQRTEEMQGRLGLLALIAPAKGRTVRAHLWSDGMAPHRAGER